MTNYYDVGVGNQYRKLSQYPLLRTWKKRYGITSILQAPYDPYINDDQDIFHSPYVFSQTLEDFSDGSYDFVFNFGFIQRYPNLIFQMRRVARLYVAAFVPNGYNFGHSFVHPFYHRMTKSVCNHIDRGDRSLMTLQGLRYLFLQAGTIILEEGYIDIPPWFDTVVHLTELFGSGTPNPLRFPMPKQLVCLEHLWPSWFRKVHAHHVYVLAKLDNT